MSPWQARVRSACHVAGGSRRARWLIILLLAGCASEGRDETRGTFGVGDGCDRACIIDGETWIAPQLTEAELEHLERLELIDAPGPLDSDPYAWSPAPEIGPGVCAVQPLDGDRYRLVTYVSAEDAVRGGAVPTHATACGLCSSLADLAVYLRRPDLTTPVRACALEGVLGSDEDVLACLQALGFTRPCAQIWAFNAKNTRNECIDICFELLDAPFNTPDGSLNACLACDEANSGPVFKAVAGRTRRNSGVPTAVCRPCEGVFPALHRY